MPGRRNKRGNLAWRKGYEPGLEEILMCCLCFRTVLVGKGIGLMSLSALRLSCLVGNSVHFHSHVFLHELLHPSLFNAMRTTLAIYRSWFHLLFDMCAGMNGICLLACDYHADVTGSSTKTRSSGRWRRQGRWRTEHLAILHRRQPGSAGRTYPGPRRLSLVRWYRRSFAHLGQVPDVMKSIG